MNLKEQRNKKILRGLSKNAFITRCIANSMRVVFSEISISQYRTVLPDQSTLQITDKVLDSCIVHLHNSRRILKIR